MADKDTPTDANITREEITVVQKLRQLHVPFGEWSGFLDRVIAGGYDQPCLLTNDTSSTTARALVPGTSKAMKHETTPAGGGTPPYK